MNKKIQVIFYKAYYNPNATFIDKSIAWWTNSAFSHVELVIDGYMYSTSPRDGMVRRRKYIYDPVSWQTISLDNIDIEKVLKFYTKTQGLKYDWPGIFGFISPVSDREDRYFCSEWVTKALIIGGCEKLYPIEPSKTSPGRLFNLIQYH